MPRISRVQDHPPLSFDGLGRGAPRQLTSCHGEGIRVLVGELGGEHRFEIVHRELRFGEQSAWRAGY